MAETDEKKAKKPEKPRPPAGSDQADKAVKAQKAEKAAKGEKAAKAAKPEKADKAAADGKAGKPAAAASRAARAGAARAGAPEGAVRAGDPRQARRAVRLQEPSADSDRSTRSSSTWESARASPTARRWNRPPPISRSSPGRRRSITKARKSIATYKLRTGQAIGCKVTLRKTRMYEFVDRLINIALPRVRDFRGLNPKSFDGRGNYTLGIKEHIVFPEIDYDKAADIWGMDITVCTTARSDDEARALLTAFNFPFRQ